MRLLLSTIQRLLAYRYRTNAKRQIRMNLVEMSPRRTYILWGSPGVWTAIGGFSLRSPFNRFTFMPTVPAAAGKRERPDRDFQVRGLICRRRRQKVAGGLHGGCSQWRISIRKRFRKQDLGHFLVRRLPSRPPRSSLSFEDSNGERGFPRSRR